MNAKSSEDISTQDRILNAARILFHKKGFAATRTRDIAEGAGINLALLNYHFKSKKLLYNIVMHESVQGFLNFITEVIHNADSSLYEKVETIVENYILLVKKQPDIPLFVINEMNTNPDELVSKLGSGINFNNSVFIKQVQEKIRENNLPEVNPLQFFVNIMGLTIFPFIARPMIKSFGELSDNDFDKLIIERKKLIPLWFSLMLKQNN
jgi:AcrR family transcriptional regulator